MSIEIVDLDERGLRRFALTTGAIVALLFGLALPLLLGIRWPTWPWLVGATLALWGLVLPASLRPVYRGWMRFGLVMNRIVTPAILAAVFYLVVTPLALIVRVLGRDAMQRRFDARRRSYRVPSRREPREKMEKPY